MSFTAFRWPSGFFISLECANPLSCQSTCNPFKCNPLHRCCFSSLRSEPKWFQVYTQGQKNGNICWLPPPFVCDWLVPSRPHVVRDTLAHMVAVVETSLAYRSGLSAWQLVAARRRENIGWNSEKRKKKRRKRRVRLGNGEEIKKRGLRGNWSLCMDSIDYPDKNIRSG